MDIRAAHRAMRNRRNRAWFRNLWQSNATEPEFYALAARLNPALTRQEFDHDWQFAVVRHPRYAVAVQEFTQLLFGGL